MTVLYNIFMKRTLTDDYWGLHKNMNCVFPLKHVIVIEADNVIFIATSIRKVMKGIRTIAPRGKLPPG